MAYEVLVLDIDGTLTNSDKVITPKTLEAILETQKRGHTVVLASGRPTPGIVSLAKQLKLDEYGGYILSYNGAKIINYKTGAVIYNKVIPTEYIPEIYQIAKEHNLGLITYSKDHILSATGMNPYIELESNIIHIPVVEIDNWAEFVDFPVNKCLMSADGDYLKTIEPIVKEHFKDRLNVYRSEPFFLEIMPQSIDKAHSLGKLLNHLGLSKEQLISCGDGFNDISMIEYAGLGVAMANAQSKVKESADYITLSNNEDGVAHVIEQFMK